jgi:hypothetical protein
MQYYNDASGVFSRNYRGDRIEVRDNSNLQYQQASAASNGVQRSQIEVKLTINPDEFSRLLRQKAVEIINTGMRQNGSGL